MTGQPDAILFYARDFLADEFPKFQNHLGGAPRVYIVSKSAEVARIAQADPEGAVYNLAEYIARAHTSAITRDAVFHAMHRNVARDRFMRRMAPDQISPIVHGLRSMLDEIAARFRIRVYMDEPVSGFVNECLNHWVRAQGGMPCHFQVTWLPGYMFFCSDGAQQEPIPLDRMENAREMVDAHYEKRLNNQALPLYVHNYGSTFRTLKEAARYAALGLNRRLRKSEIFLDADPWPHDFQAKSLMRSVTARYTSLDDLKKLGDARIFVYPLHYEPEAVILYVSDFTDQMDLVHKIFDHLPADSYLVLKEHPSQPGAAHLPKWRHMLENKRLLVVRGTDRMSDILAMDNSAVVSLGSTAAIESAMFGRPTFLMGTPYFMGLPGMTVIDHQGEISFDDTVPTMTRAEFVDGYSAFFARYATRGVFMRGRTDIPEAASLLQSLWDQAGAARTA
ncbi:MAG: hypothetical protein AB8B85_01145 [Paracoccaceae bacterium]